MEGTGKGVEEVRKKNGMLAKDKDGFLTCYHCDYRWKPRKKGDPVSCPRCKKRFDWVY